ncbi:amidohydrolase [Methylocaldum marinum]|uniref:Amidohydrolase n=1 Tax=Methylocaldum marinum TaxID=1432792 RepID=A0A250KPL4_9GAMM|nr:amidohydrolase [Methylocaldum marinum]
MARLVCQTPRIHPRDRIRRILVQIEPARQSNRVLADEPPDLGIIVPERIVVRPGLVVGVLARLAQRTVGGERRWPVGFGQDRAEPLPRALKRCGLGSPGVHERMLW